MAEDDGEPAPDEVETWPPEEDEAADVPPAASPDHEQARQGAREPPTRSGPGTRGSEASDAEARNWAAGAHLSSLVGLLGIPSILGPLVVWLVKREDHPFVADQSREALNFQISVLVYAIVGVIAAVIFAIATLGMGLFVVLPAAAIFVVGVLLLPVYAAFRASDGEPYRYPFTLRLISGTDVGRRTRR